ncbi:MAG: twin-arginine translocase subunit TatC [Bacteroidota bacterium]|nr:twin-arginine translocase subunit TatC [Bacteroidota bacterium]
MLLFKRKNVETRAEMSFVDHLDVLRAHLFRSVISIVAGAAIVAYFNKFFVGKVLMGPTHSDFPTYNWLCRIGRSLNLGDALCMKEIGVQMQNTNVSGQFSMFFTVIIVGGIIISFPYVFWEFWRFIKPGLSKKELAKTRGVIFWVSLLFFTGVGFGYFIIAPYTVNFFSNFQLDASIENRWTITSYIDTLVPLILGTGLAFQLPLVMFFLSRIGIVNSKFLKKGRKYAIVIIVIISGIITPPDIVSQIVISVPLLLLYEVSIWLTARVEREEEEKDKLEWS